MLNVKLNFMPLQANFSRSIDVVERVGVYAQSLTAFAYVGRRFLPRDTPLYRLGTRIY
jgi:hypothetical protein